MKYLGEKSTKEIVKKIIRKVDYIRCDKCNKKIMPSKLNLQKESNYIHVHTWHYDWGNDSIESHKHKDYCRDCAKQVVLEYVSNLSGTEHLELQNRYLLKDQMNEVVNEWEDEDFDDEDKYFYSESNARLACYDQTDDKGGEL